MDATATEQGARTEQEVSSFAKSLFLGEIHEDVVFPFPRPPEDDQRRTRELIRQIREFGESYDEREVEERRWIGDDKIRELGERGLMGLYVPQEYGGAGLTQTGYCRVSEEFAQIDGTPVGPYVRPFRTTSERTTASSHGVLRWQRFAHFFQYLSVSRRAWSGVTFLGGRECDANQVRTNGTRSPFLTVNSATVVRYSPRDLTGVRRISPFGPAITSNPPFPVRTHGIVRP